MSFRAFASFCLFALVPSTQAFASDLVGTYASPDGSMQIIVDRESQPPRMQEVGSKAVVQLTLLERGREGWDAYTPSGDWMFFLDRYGRLTRNRETLSQVDSAKPLKKITDAGVYVPPPSPYDVAHDALEPISVLSALEGFVAEDSGNPNRIGEAFDKATKGMVVHYVWTHKDAAVYQPVSPVVGITDHGSAGYHPTDAVFDASAAGPAGHGVVVQGDAWVNGHVRIVGTTPKGFSGELATGSVGLVWSVDGASVVFVTMDGGRYRLNIAGTDLEKGGGHPFKPGVGLKDAPAMQHTRLDAEDIDLLVKAKILPESALAPLNEAEIGWRSCVEQQAKSREKDLAQLQQSDLGWSAKNARAEAMNEEIEKTAQTACASHLEAYRAHLEGQIDARIADREALARKVTSSLKK